MSQNLELVRKIYQSFATGDVATIFAAFDPSMVWVAAESSPLGDKSPYHGIPAIQTGVFQRIGAEFPDLKIRPDEWIEAGNKIIVLGRYEGTRKATGKKFQAQLAHVWTLSNGKTTQFQQYTDTLSISKSA